MCSAHCARSDFSKRIEDDGGGGAQLVSALKLNADKAGRCRMWCRENRQHDERKYGKHVILQFFIYQLLCNNGLSPYSSGERRDTGRRRRRHRRRVLVQLDAHLPLSFRVFIWKFYVSRRNKVSSWQLSDCGFCRYRLMAKSAIT